MRQWQFLDADENAALMMARKKSDGKSRCLKLKDASCLAIAEHVAMVGQSGRSLMRHPNSFHRGFAYRVFLGKAFA